MHVYIYQGIKMSKMKGMFKIEFPLWPEDKKISCFSSQVLAEYYIHVLSYFKSSLEKSEG